MTFFSSLTFAVALALIVLLLCYPFVFLIAERPCAIVILYGVILVFSIVLIYFYLVVRCVTDKRDCRSRLD